MASCSKKRKVDMENRAFQEKWTKAYFVIERNEKPLCLICLYEMAVNKEFNIKRHYLAKHLNYEKYVGDERSEKIENFKKMLFKQETVFHKSTKELEMSTKAGYVIATKIAHHSKPFSEGEFFKECMIAAVELIGPEYKKKFENISLSRRTVTRRIEELSTDIKKTLKQRIYDFDWYSLALDESTDITDTAQLSIFIRGIDNNFIVTEEMLSLEQLATTTKGEDIFNKLKSVLEDYNLNYHNLSGLSTDGAKSMVGKNKGVLALLKKDMGENEFNNKFVFHCIIHQHNLCSKIENMEHVMTVVVKCINEIKSKSAVIHREFMELLKEADVEYTDLTYYCEVRWLSKNAMLKRFLDLIEEVDRFMGSKGKSIHELQNEEWISDLSFLVDITTHLNDLNLNLQKENQFVTDMFGSVRAFQNKLKLFQCQLKNNNFIHFASLEKKFKTKFDKQKYIDIIIKLEKEFNERFTDFLEKEIYFEIFSSPFLIQVNKIPDDFQMEILELKEKSHLRMIFLECSYINFYKSLDPGEFPNLINNAKKIISLFGSTYKCEQFFSKMSFTKSKIRSRIVDDNLVHTLRIATTNITPDIDTLTKNKQWQQSH